MVQRIDVFLVTENRLLREALMRIFGQKSDLCLVLPWHDSRQHCGDTVAHFGIYGPSLMVLPSQDE